MKKGLVEKVVILTIAIGIILETVILSNSASNTVYQYLFLLPLLHGIIMFLFFTKSRLMLKYPAQKIIYILYFLRNVVTPLLLMKNKYNLGIIITSKSDVNFSIFLMIYETFMVFLTLSQSKKIRISMKKRKKKNYFIDRKIIKQKTFNYLLATLTLFTLMLWLVVP